MRTARDRTPVLSRSAHDRIAHRRTDEAWFEQVWRNDDTRVLVMSADAKVLAPSGDRIEYVSPAAVETEGLRLLLGEHDGLVYVAVLATQQLSGPGWAGLRELAVQLSTLDGGLLTATVAMQAWHASHTHCPRCGSPTAPVQAGWVRRCTFEGSQHFPRTDPAVIMLVTDDASDRCLLGRSVNWPTGRFSTLAGFVEAGESAEAAVAREVAEEVGVRVTDVRYVASQPHPFPASLMLGFTAKVTGDPTLKADNDEIAEAGWFTRAEVRKAMERDDASRAATAWDAPAANADGAAAGSPADRLWLLPPAMSIARQLINDWVAAG